MAVYKRLKNSIGLLRRSRLHYYRYAVVKPPLWLSANGKMARLVASDDAGMRGCYAEVALAEAMACSCVPVMTRTGFGATLSDGQEAWVCDFDDAAEMERSIMALLLDEELRGRMARRAWTRVRSLSWEVNVRRLESLYREWTAEHQRIGANSSSVMYRRPLDESRRCQS